MSDLNDTFVQPDAALAGADDLGVAGATLASRWRRLASTITTLNGGSPWGTDEPGREFNKNYLDGEKPAEAVLNLGNQVVPVVEQMGPAVRGAVEGTVDTDDMTRMLFGGEDK